MTDARLGGLGREALVSSTGELRVGGLVREALVSGVGLSGTITSRSFARAPAVSVVGLSGTIASRSFARTGVALTANTINLSGTITSRAFARADVQLNLAGNVTAQSQGRGIGPSSFMFLGGRIGAGSSLVGVMPSTELVEDQPYVVTVIT